MGIQAPYSILDRESRSVLGGGGREENQRSLDVPYTGKSVICKIQGSVEAILHGPQGDQVLKFLPACAQRHEVTCSLWSSATGMTRIPT